MTIQWESWGEPAFSRCRRDGKPLLLSLMARWCHACHRMDDETWDDAGVAAVVEQAAIPVRVDADERPDVYGRYHLGGLPTTALLDAEGEFVRGGTYLSPAELQRFLDLALEDWRARRRPARRAAPEPTAPRPTLAAGGHARPHGKHRHLVDQVIARLAVRFDREHGGFGMAPKLVETEALTLLVRQWRHSGEPALEQMVRMTLDAVVAHLGDPCDGGFFRYAAGADWTGPHTEKIALDQGQIARTLLEAGAALGEARYADAACGALSHARGRLADSAGRVFASVAADPEYYERRREARGSADTPDGDRERELEAVTLAAPESIEMPLVDRRRFADGGAAVADAAWLALAVTGEDYGFRPEFREVVIGACGDTVRFSDSDGPSGPVDLNERDGPGDLDGRTDPGDSSEPGGPRDPGGSSGPGGPRCPLDLSDHEGRTGPRSRTAPGDFGEARSLSGPGGPSEFDGPSGAGGARDSGSGAGSRASVPVGAIPHRLDAPDALVGVLRDQALAIAATLAEYRVTGDSALLGWCVRAADWTIAHLWDERVSAFRSEPEAPRDRVPLPPMFPLLANGEMALALVDLADHVGRPDYRHRAERVVAALGDRAVRSPVGAALALVAQRLDDNPAEAEIDGDSADPRARELARVVVAALGPTTVVRWSTAGAAPAEGAPGLRGTSGGAALAAGAPAQQETPVAAPAASVPGQRGTPVGAARGQQGRPAGAAPAAGAPEQRGTPARVAPAASAPAQRGMPAEAAPAASAPGRRGTRAGVAPLSETPHRDVARDAPPRGSSTPAPSVTVCVNDVCLPPAADVDQLLEALAGAGLAHHGILAAGSKRNSRHPKGSGLQEGC